MLPILEQDVISRDPNRAAFMPVITPLSGGDWLAFSLLLRHAITGAVNRLLGSTSHWLPFTREGPSCPF